MDAIQDGKIQLYNKRKAPWNVLAKNAPVSFTGRTASGPGSAQVSPSQAAYLLNPASGYEADITADRGEAMTGLKLYRASFSQEQIDVVANLTVADCVGCVKMLSAGEEKWSPVDNTVSQLRTRVSDWMSGPQTIVGSLPIHPADKAMKEEAAKLLKEEQAVLKAAQDALAVEAREKAEAEAKAKLKAEAAAEVKPPENGVSPAPEYTVVKEGTGKYVVIRTATKEKMHDKPYLKKNSAEALYKRLSDGQ